MADQEENLEKFGEIVLLMRRFMKKYPMWSNIRISDFVGEIARTYLSPRRTVRLAERDIYVAVSVMELVHESGDHRLAADFADELLHVLGLSPTEPEFGRDGLPTLSRDGLVAILQITRELGEYGYGWFRRLGSELLERIMGKLDVSEWVERYPDVVICALAVDAEVGRGDLNEKFAFAIEQILQRIDVLRLADRVPGVFGALIEIASKRRIPLFEQLGPRLAERFMRRMPSGNWIERNPEAAAYFAQLAVVERTHLGRTRGNC
jgi:hypothetical protein